jgi:hypothetical protein
MGISRKSTEACEEKMMALPETTEPCPVKTRACLEKKEGTIRGAVIYRHAVFLFVFSYVLANMDTTVLTLAFLPLPFIAGIFCCYS